MLKSVIENPSQAICMVKFDVYSILKDLEKRSFKEFIMIISAI